MGTMGVKLNKEPELKDPVMLCGWAGIGNVGLVAINAMRRLVRAEEFGEIQPDDFFEPSRAVIRDGLIEEMRFPATKFYSYRGQDRDLIFLAGEQQPADGRKVYEMAGLVLDVAAQFGCRRVYTSGASVTMTHHTAKPRVWAVPNHRSLIPEVRRYGNTVLMSEAGDTEGAGTITGLNGLLLGVARHRQIDAVCLMGEVPYYVQGAPWPYPKASISVLEVLGRVLHLSLDLRELHETAAKVEANIEQILEALATAEELPEQVRTEMDKLLHPPQTQLGPITEAEKKEILDHIDELFRTSSP
jgi:proteasome assembly chaperone (PAC2) family protein